MFRIESWVRSDIMGIHVTSIKIFIILSCQCSENRSNLRVMPIDIILIHPDLCLHGVHEYACLLQYSSIIDVFQLQDYTPYSCQKIISLTPGVGDHHGCPYRHFRSII